jgi:hypothetical protein
MFNSVALDVAISLVFIYLLYSLLATVLSEIIATTLGLRARNLKEAVDRMLSDQKVTNFWLRFWDSLNFMKNPNNKVINAFYNTSEIKYLGSQGMFSIPSAFKASSFSKALLNILLGDGPVTREKVESALGTIIRSAEGVTDEDKKIKILDSETAKYILGLWEDSGGDLEKFKLQIEAWFDRTMEQATEWYKRKIQIVLLVLGFFMAWFFYADTFMIVKNLSVDKSAREQMVSMVNAYVQNNKTVIDNTIKKDSADLKSFNQKLDSLMAVKSKLEADIAVASGILGLGGWLPDTVIVAVDAKSKLKIYNPQLDPASLSGKETVLSGGKIHFTFKEKLNYMLRLFYHHFFGFLITAIAISLGAPFWFDLLNKLMKLRVAIKEKVGGSTSSLVRKDAGGEAVG